MSQRLPPPLPPTPPARRQAEAEAIYQLLQLVNADLKQERRKVLDTTSVVVTTRDVPADGQWHQMHQVVKP